MPQQNLDNTILTAPFTGTISSRSVDPFLEVTAGTTVFELQSEGALKVNVLMPETLIRDVSFGRCRASYFSYIKRHRDQWCCLRYRRESGKW